MSKQHLKMLNNLLLPALLLIACSAIKSPAFDLKIQEIISKHLDSIGTKEKRDGIKNSLAVGTSGFCSKLPEKDTSGKSVVASEKDNLLFITSFASNEYPFEKVGYFNGKINLPFIASGTRSPLGAFISDHSSILSEGIMTGSISARWYLLNSQMDIKKFDTAGAKKVNGRKAYVLNYHLGGGSQSFLVKLFFDAENFHHIRTEYTYIIPARDAVFGQLGSQQGNGEMTVTEDFDDFKEEAGLTLPHKYKIKYLASTNTGTFEYDWNIAISQYMFNQSLKPDFFKF